MNAQLAYLQMDVATACGPKLRLLLIEAALRLAHENCVFGQNRQPHEFGHALRLLRRILLQLLCSLDQDHEELAGKLKSVYRYLLCTVEEVQLTRDTQKLGDVERVLKIERETWQIITDRYLAEMAVQQQTPRLANILPSITSELVFQKPEPVVPSLAKLDCVA
jgi:flagellar biosynthetic protein FliS